MKKLFVNISHYSKEKTCVESCLVNCMPSDLKKIYFENIWEGLLSAYMSLKGYKLDQGATEMFISELENTESLCNAMSEIHKNGDTKKRKFQKISELFEMSGS